MFFLDKIKENEGGTHVVEILITIPIIICLLFMPVSVYQLTQQQNYIEDTKTRLVQEMSRKGELTSSDINKWKNEFNKMDGVSTINITSVSKTYRDETNSLMTSVLTFKLKPSIFSIFFGGTYTTKAMIYSEAIKE